jgi:formylglycine-generating enzyme required for sulfatase activity
VEAGTLYAATAGAHGELYILDPNTGGVLHDVGPLNDAAGRNYPMEGLAFHPHTGVLYGSTHYSPTADPATVSRLVTINPDTAEVTVVGEFKIGSGYRDNPGTMSDLTFTGWGTLSGIGPFVAGDDRPALHRIDLNTGASQFFYLYQSFPPLEGGGLAVPKPYSRDVWSYYLTPNTDELFYWYLQDDPSQHMTGLLNRRIGDLAKPAGGGNYGALDFDGDVLYGLNVGPGSPPQTHLVRINTGTGAVTDIGRSVDGLAAIAFIPEPDTIALIATAFALLIASASRRANASLHTLVSRRGVATAIVISISIQVAPQSARAVTIDWITIGNPGNPPEWQYGRGSVPYVYRIGKYDVTVNQYVEFLNQKDPTGANTLALYGPEMSDTTHGGIRFDAAAPDGSKYEVIAGRGNHPANYITWYDAIRFANWLHNGQGNGDTESGAYTLVGGTPTPSNGQTISRNAGAAVFIPNEDEWIKAGYYLPGTNIYFQFPTTTNTPPVSSPPTDVVNRANFRPNGPGTVTDVGAYPGTWSPYGAFDMAGNVLQWIEDWRGPPDPGNPRLLKGMHFDDDHWIRLLFGQGQGFGASAALPTVGFRVASMVPEPSGQALALVCGALMCWSRRRER